MTAVPASAATTTINTFKPNVRILEFSPERAIDQKRRFQENTPAPPRRSGAGAIFHVEAAGVPAASERIQRRHACRLTDPPNDSGPHHGPVKGGVALADDFLVDRVMIGGYGQQ
jgi:hypothetical protein